MPLIERLSLNEPYSVRGKWWPSEHPDDKRLGEFSFLTKGPSKLELYEPFESMANADDSKPLIINGQSEKGHLMSLLSCCRSFRGGTLGGTGFNFTSESYIVNRALIGGAPEDHGNGAQYYSLEMRIDNLEEWIGFRPFEEEYEKDPPRTIKAVNLRHFQTINFQLNSLEAEFEIDFTNMLELGSFSKLCWKRNSQITLTPNKPQTLDWFSNQAALIQSFFSLLIGHLVHTSHLTVRGNENQILPNTRNRSTINILYHREGAPLSRPCSHPALMLIRQVDIGEKLPELLNRWFLSYDLLNLPLQILWSVQGGGYAFKESEFIAITQAVEAFSRARGDGLYLSKEEWVPFYESMKVAIPQELSDDNRKSLDNRLLYGNEFSLSKRLTILIRGLPEGVQDLIAPDGVSKFVRAIVDTRNQMTHREHGQDYALTGIELVRANLRLQLLLVLLALQKIGVPDEQLNPAAQRCEYFRMIVPRN